MNEKNLKDVDKRWALIGSLVERFGSEEEKIAWALCRGDAAEWRLPSQKEREENHE